MNKLVAMLQVVSKLSKGEPIHVTRLVDEAWAASLNAIAGTAERTHDIL
jgi:hypothetical protein